MRIRVAAPLALAFVLTSLLTAQAADWPQFHGPNRDNLCSETGLLDSWPEGGPKMLWKMEGLGTAYSSVSIVGNRLYTMGDRKPEGSKEPQQMLLAFDLGARKLLWEVAVGKPHSGGGPRCTPTVDGSRVYAIGTDGDLVCVETEAGKVVWRKNFATDFGGKMMTGWKYSESPLVDGEKLVCTPGASDAAIVALDKSSGRLLWKTALPVLGSNGVDGAGYSSMVAREVAGVRQYVQLLGRGVIGVEADSGRFLWGYNRVANKVANITTPVVRGDNVFASTAYKTGSVLLKIAGAQDAWKADEVYWLDYTAFANHHGGVVLVGDYLYGGDGQNNGAPVCIEFLTGKIVWKEKSLGKRSAAVLYADGHVYFRYEDGLVVLMEASPKGLKVKGKLEQPIPEPRRQAGPAWAHPVIADKKLYLRHNDVVFCYDVAKR